MPEVRENSKHRASVRLGDEAGRRSRMRDGGVPEANTEGPGPTRSARVKSLKRRGFVAATRVARPLTPRL